MQTEKNLFYYLSILFEWRRFIIINFIIIILLTVVISLLLPNWYKSSTTLIQPKQSDIFSNLGATGSLLRGISGLGRISGLGGQRSGTYNYFAILRSRTTFERVIKKFDLINVYDTKDSSMELTIKELMKNVNFEEDEDDKISIEVYDKDPLRAAAMANYFVEVLNEINIQLGTQEAKNNRMFIEQRLQEANTALFRAEDSLRKFQERSGLIITPEQTSGIDAIATLYSMKVKKEVEVAIMERSIGSDNTTLQQLKIELSELNKKIAGIPHTGMESLRLYREVAIQQKIVEFLVPLYEQARIEEQKNIPVLLVLDKAVPAEKKIKPQRSLIVFLSSSIALVLLILLTFLFHGVRKKNDDMSVLESKLHRISNYIATRYKVHLP